MAAILKISDLHKQFGPLEVLRGISLDVDPGQVVALEHDLEGALVAHVAVLATAHIERAIRCVRLRLFLSRLLN